MKETERQLFFASALLLFGELLAIRWLTIEVPAIKIFPNLVLLVVLVAASAGLADTGRFKVKTPVLMAALTILLGTVIFSVALGLPAMSIKVGFTSPLLIVFHFALLFLLIGCLLAIFINIGRLLGEGFANLKPLRAYSVNLLGSLAGIIMVASISAFQVPPPVWIVACGLLCLPLAPKRLVAGATAVFAVAASITTLGSYWSPYSKLDVTALKGLTDEVIGSDNFVVNSNNHPFHLALRMLTDEQSARLASSKLSAQNGLVRHYYDSLQVSFQAAPKHDRVLVLGGGSGNDVAYALAHGAKHVDVVEIDPIISRFGKELHPDKPYVDQRVTLYTEDARTFLRYSKEKYDLIEFAYLDPGNTLNTASFIRVDNFVYTVPAIKSALEHLNPDGLLSLSFGTGGPSPVTRRLYQTIGAANGTPPIAFVDDPWDSVLFLAGPAATATNVSEHSPSPYRHWPRADEKTASQPSTDDWPFLFLEDDVSGAILYFGVLLVAVVLPAVLLTKADEKTIGRQAWGNMFFLGQAFMLVETKSITQMSLFFGATWLSSSAVVGCILMLAFAANWLASKIKSSVVWPYYCGLAIALVLDYCFTVPSASSLHPMLMVAISTLVSCLPVFFGGLIFSLCFRQAKAPQIYLSANLLGVAVGGLTENLCLLSGIKSLIIIAGVLYGLSLIALLCLKKGETDTLQPVEAAG
jgi:hypothetical protein